MHQAPGVGHDVLQVARGRARLKRAGLLLLAIAPLAALPWLLSYWPSVDGPNHLALVHILGRLGEPGDPFGPYLASELRVGSYSLYYWLMLGLGRVMDLHLADRLVQTAIIAGLPLSVLYLVRRIAPERRHNVLAIVPLATGWLVMLGFVNFLLGFLLGLLALGTLWGRSGGRVDPVAPPSWRARAAAGVLLLLASIAHPFPAFMIAAALLLLEGPALRFLRTWICIASVTGPAFALAGAPVVAGWLDGRGGPGLGQFDYLWVNEVVLRSVENTVLTFSSWELLLRGVPLVVLAAVALRCAARRSLRGSERDDGLARLVWGLLALYLIVPDRLSSIAFISPRFTLLFAVACALIASGGSAIGRRAAPVMVALVWIVASVQYAAMSGMDARVRDIVAAGRHVPRGSTLLPLMFETNAGAANLFPLLHAWGHVVIERDAVVPYLFASGGTAHYGGGDFRPLRFRQPFSPTFLPNLGERAPPRLDDPFTGPRLLPGERLGYRTQPDMLPRVAGVTEPGTDCSFESWIALRHRAILSVALAYDRVLVYGPDEAFLRRALPLFSVEAQVGEAWLLRPRPGAVAPGGELLCGEATP